MLLRNLRGLRFTSKLVNFQNFSSNQNRYKNFCTRSLYDLAKLKNSTLAYHEAFSTYETHLADSSFIGSEFSANLKDIEVFDSVKDFVEDYGQQRLDGFPNFKRWYKFVEKNYDNIDRTPVAQPLSMSLSVDEKYNLISRNLQEVLGEDRIKKVLNERDLKVYWGTATTGRPHIAYFVPMCKIADLLKAGCEVTVLLADLHGYLDNMKAPWELIGKRANYYKIIITEMLKAIDVPIEKLKFVQGTDYQLSREYNLDVYKLSSMVTERDAKKAGAQVVKQVDSPLLSGLLYPLLQGLDEHYLGVDCQFGGVDQRKIFTFSEEYMPKLGYKKCAHLMNKMVPGLTGDKMSSSDIDSKIDLLDSPKDVKRKINRAFCEPGNIENNGLISFADAVLFPIFGEMTIKRKEEHGGNVTYKNVDDLREDFKNEKLWPGDLKSGVTDTINKLLDPIRKTFEEDQAKKEVMYAAYPEFAPKKAAGGKNKGGAGGKGGKKGPPQAAPITPGRLNIRVGHITKVEAHPNSEKLYIETVDFGDQGQRTILSGLGGTGIEMSDLENTKRPFLINLKPAKLGGIESQGMLLCASKTDGDNKSVGLLSCPENATPGAKVLIEGFEKDEADERLNPKKKIWETLAPDFKVNSEGDCVYQDKKIMLDNQVSIISDKLKDAQIS